MTARPFALAALTTLLLMLAAATVGTIGSGCGGEASKPADTVKVDSGQSLLPPGPPVEPPPPSPIIVKEDSIKCAKSPFRDVACCCDKAKRRQDFSCCYEGLLEKYRALRKTKTPKEIGDLKATDPALGDCQKDPKCRKTLAEIDAAHNAASNWKPDN